MKRRLAVLVATSLVLMAAVGGRAAVAVLIGTPAADRIVGSAWDDFIDGWGGNDRISGGNDLIRANDDANAGGANCGRGTGTVTVDSGPPGFPDQHVGCEVRRTSQPRTP